MSDKFHLIVRPSNLVVSGQIIHGRLRKHLFYCDEEFNGARMDKKRVAVMRKMIPISKTEIEDFKERGKSKDEVK